MRYPLIGLMLFSAGLIEGLAFAFVLYARRGKWREIGFITPAPLWVYAAALCAAALYSVLTSWATPMVAITAIQISPLKGTALFTAVMAGTFEEVVFRGIIITALQNAGRSKPIQIAVSGLAFGAVHAIWGVNTDHFLTSIIQPVLWTSAYGMIFAAIYVYGKRSLGPVILGHILTDAIIEPGLFLAAVLHR